MRKRSEKVEEYKVTGDKLITKVKEIIDAGEARSIVIKSNKGKPIMEIPVIVSVAGTVLAPYLTVLGVIAVIVSNCTIVVKKK